MADTPSIFVEGRKEGREKGWEEGRKEGGGEEAVRFSFSRGSHLVGEMDFTDCSRWNRAPSSKNVHSETVNVTLFGKSVFGEVIKLMIQDEIILDVLGGPKLQGQVSFLEEE